jgi:hypothetical protein
VNMSEYCLDLQSEVTTVSDELEQFLAEVLLSDNY